MKKTSIIFFPVIVLLAYLLCTPCFGAADNVSMNKGIQASLRFFQKDREMQLNDLPAKARDKISRHLQKAEYEVSRYESTLPSGKTSRYQTFNHKQNISIYFTEQGIHLLPNGRESLPGIWR